MSARFHLQDPSGRLFSVDKRIQIGRSRECEIVVQDAQASRHHATVWEQQDCLYIQDEGSVNGTFVNGHVLQGPQRLNHNDRIRVGGSDLIVRFNFRPEAAGVGPVTAPHNKPGKSLRARTRISTPCLMIAIVGGLLGILGIGALAGSYILLNRNGSPTESQGIVEPVTAPQAESSRVVIALALRLDHHPGALSGYIGPAVNTDQNEMFWLPAGSYYLEALVQGKYYALGMIPVASRQNGGDWIDISGLASLTEENDIDQSERLLTLVNFLVSLELNRLRFYEVISSGYLLPIYSHQVTVDREQLAYFYTGLSNVGERDVLVANAIDSLAMDARAVRESSYLGSRRFIVSSHQDEELRSEIFNFFQMSKDSHQVAIDLIAHAAGQMTPEQKSEAFDQIAPADKGSAQNFDDMITKLQSGELPYKGWRVHGQLYLYSDGYRNFVDQKLAEDHGNSEINRAQLFLAQQEGGKMLQAGAQLNVKIIKTILTAGLPGIEQGFDYADQVNAWAEYIRDVYQDPVKTLGSSGIEKIRGDLQEQIKSGILGLDPNLDESDADELAGQISSHVSDQIQQMINQAAQSTSTTENEGIGQGTNPGDSGMGGDGDTSWIDVYIEEIIAEMVQGGVESMEGIDSNQIVDFANDLEACLRDAMAQGFSREIAEGLCMETVSEFYVVDEPKTGFDGNWYGPLCPNDADFAYQWGVGLIQDDSGAVRGTVRLHFCPGGGSAIYQVSGAPMPENSRITLEGELIESYGEQGKNAPPLRTFSFSTGPPPKLEY